MNLILLLSRHVSTLFLSLSLFLAAEAAFGALRIFDRSIPALTPPPGVPGYDACGPSVGPELTSLPSTPHWDTLGLGQHHVERTIGQVISGANHVQRDLLASSSGQQRLSLRATKVVNNNVSMTLISSQHNLFPFLPVTIILSNPLFSFIIFFILTFCFLFVKRY